jgi:cytochrome P450
MQNALKGGGINAELPVIRALLRLIPVKSLQEVVNGNDFLMSYGLEARRMLKSQPVDRTIFGLINREAEKEGGHLDEIDVLLEAQGLLVAGSDTTAISMTYLVWAVLSHPIWQNELEKEVAALPATFSDKDLEELPILSAVIEETLRLYGAAPGGLPRIVPKGGVSLAGHFIPTGTTVTTQSYTLHRDPNLFPEPYKSVTSRRFVEEC